MSTTYSCADASALSEAVGSAARVLSHGECIVMPTDTVYGIGCDAFSAVGVQSLLAAKGRTREMPPPVLIPDVSVLDGLADMISSDTRALAHAFWPGALTLVCWAQPTLGWDLGETHGTVALRVPDDRVALAVLQAVGPLAVSSANLTGMNAARTAAEAQDMLGERVSLYLEDGARPVDAQVGEALASTIVDCTGTYPRVLRQGTISLDALRAVVPATVGVGEDGPAQSPEDQVTAVEDPVGGSVESEDITGITLVEPAAPSQTASANRLQRTHVSDKLIAGPGASEEDVARALVGHNSALPRRGRVDQDRRRGETPPNSGIHALSVEEALNVVEPMPRTQE